MEFYQTGYGKKFFESDLPKLVKALEKVGNELEKQNAYAENLMGGMTGSRSNSIPLKEGLLDELRIVAGMQEMDISLEELNELAEDLYHDKYFNEVLDNAISQKLEEKYNARNNE